MANHATEPNSKQRLRDYLNPGGWRVYEQIKAETRSEYYDIDLRWLSVFLSAEYSAAPIEIRKKRPPLGHSTPMFDRASIELHLADLVKTGAVIKEQIGKHTCYVALEYPQITITDDMLASRKDEKRRLKNDICKTDALLERAFP